MELTSEMRNWILQLLALLFINAFAFVYDAQWINVAVIVDALALGVNLKDVWQRKNS